MARASSRIAAQQATANASRPAASLTPKEQFLLGLCQNELTLSAIVTNYNANYNGSHSEPAIKAMRTKLGKKAFLPPLPSDSVNPPAPRLTPEQEFLLGLCRKGLALEAIHALFNAEYTATYGLPAIKTMRTKLGKKVSLPPLPADGNNPVALMEAQVVGAGPQGSPKRKSDSSQEQDQAANKKHKHPANPGLHQPFFDSVTDYEEAIQVVDRSPADGLRPELQMPGPGSKERFSDKQGAQIPPTGQPDDTAEEKMQFQKQSANSKGINMREHGGPGDRQIIPTADDMMPDNSKLLKDAGVPPCGHPSGIDPAELRTAEIHDPVLSESGDEPRGPIFPLINPDQLWTWPGDALKDSGGGPRGPYQSTAQPESSGRAYGEDPPQKMNPKMDFGSGPDARSESVQPGNNAAGADAPSRPQTPGAGAFVFGSTGRIGAHAFGGAPPSRPQSPGSTSTLFGSTMTRSNTFGTSRPPTPAFAATTSEAPANGARAFGGDASVPPPTSAFGSGGSGFGLPPLSRPSATRLGRSTIADIGADNIFKKETSRPPKPLGSGFNVNPDAMSTGPAAAWLSSNTTGFGFTEGGESVLRTLQQAVKGIPQKGAVPKPGPWKAIGATDTKEPDSAPDKV